MKSLIVRANNLEKISRNAVLSLFLITTFYVANAQKIADDPGSPAASVTYLGYNNDQLVFCMKYENESAEKFKVNIIDAENNVLYTGVFSDKKFSKTFMVPANDTKLTFVLGNLKTKEEKKFEVNLQQHVTEEYSVTKVTPKHL
jgi:hypothetical protein